jgi:hypothetical protein
VTRLGGSAADAIAVPAEVAPYATWRATSVPVGLRAER